MGASRECVVSSSSSSSSRLKREDCNRTKHDSVFSRWKVLIGPSDWEDHSRGKEGAQKYRVHNLPNCSSCPGLYELGIAVPLSCSGRETSKLDENSIVPVYLGQAENVRTRLQHYGREGAHLENGKSTSELKDSTQQGLQLFSEIFSRGFPIVYRWAPMKNKEEAEKTEARLLGTFDYAWNKGSNGVRRPNDIFQKVDRMTSPNTRFRVIVKKLLTFQEKKRGIRVDACKPPMLFNGSTEYSHKENNDLCSRILKIGRSQPRLVSVRCGFDDDRTSICGVALAHGFVCRTVPVEGRKRCAEHKGMKVNGLTSKLITEVKSSIDVTVDSRVITDLPTCGVTLGNGTLCTKQPVRGRKRCEAHKGRKLTISNKSHNGLHAPVFSERAVINETDTICGIDLNDGTVCRRLPVVGRKRCNEHKGMRVTGS